MKYVIGDIIKTKKGLSLMIVGTRFTNYHISYQVMHMYTGEVKHLEYQYIDQHSQLEA